MAKQTYAYIKNKSILFGLKDDYNLSESEYFYLYSFFVTYSICQRQSNRMRTLKDYGWNGTYTTSGLEKAIKTILNLSDKKRFIFTDKNDLKKKFEDNELCEVSLNNCTFERCVIGTTRTISQNNKMIKLFYHIRNCLAHGNFALKYSNSTAKDKMIIMQDNDKHNVTARMVLNLDHLLDIIKIIDKNHILCSDMSLTENIQLQTA